MGPRDGKTSLAKIASQTNLVSIFSGKRLIKEIEKEINNCHEIKQRSLLDDTDKKK